MNECPCPELLQRWLADQLGNHMEQAVEVHVETCADCQRALERLTGRADTDQARGPSTPAESGREFLLRLEQQPPTGAWHSIDRDREATPVPVLPDRAGAEGPEPLPALAGYELIGELGRGGMGAVYQARQRRLKRALAVKVLLKKHHGRDELHRRFLAEARVMGALQHPGVAPIHEVGRLEDGRPFFSMKQVKGQTLAEMLKHRESLAVNRESKAASAAHDPRFTTNDSRLLNIFEQVCQTVAYAHAQRILHRDLKPANIMVGAFGEVQVMDWGLAKRVAERESPGADKPSEPAQHTSENPKSTETGRVLGTAAYMAPEQARGEVDSLDERCDVFGLGAILCEILTGAPAFPGDSRVDSHRRAVNGDLSETFARLDRCGAEAELVALARHCLAAKKEQRPRHAGAVAATLADYQARVRERLQHAEIDRAAAQVKAREERKRRKVSLALAGVLVAAVLAGAGAGVWYYHDRAAQAEAEADLQTQLAREQAGKAELEGEQAAQAAKLTERKGQLQKAVTREFAAIAQQRSALMKKLGDPLTASELLSDIDQWQALVRLARESWKRAEFLVREGKGLLDGSWSAQLKQIDQQLAADEQDWAWARELDKIREEAGSLVEGKWEPWTVKQKYAAVLQNMKLDVAKGDLGQLAEQVKGSPLRYALVAALDDWAPNLSPESPLLDRLLELSRQADPDDWRDQVRNAAHWRDTQKMKDLAATADVAKQTPQILLLVANKLAGRNHKAEAAKLLRRALLYHAKDFWLHFELGAVAANPVERVGCYRAALTVRPKSAPAHNNLGIALDKDLDGAILHFAKAIALDRKYDVAHINMGASLHLKKDYVGAIKHYHKALAIDPKVVTHFNLAKALHDKGDLEDAIQRYHRVFELKPNFVEAHNNLGMVLKSKGDLDGAIKHYDKAIKLDPNYAHAHNNLGVALSDKKDLKGAIQCYLKAIELKPNYFEAHCNLGDALRDKKDLKGAILHYQQALAIDPKLALTHSNLADVLQQTGDVPGAIKHYHESIALNPKFAPTHNNLGVALRNKGDLVGAIRHYHEAIALDAKYADPHNNLGNALKAKGDLDGAIKHYLKAIELDPKFATPHNGLGIALREKKDLDGAIKHYKKALEIKPNYVEAHNSLANALKDRKDLVGAVKHYHMALAIDPNHGVTHFNLGLVLRVQGKFAAALASLKKAQQLGAKDPSVTFPSANAIQLAMRSLELEQQLPAILKGTEQPRDLVEQIELAEMCYYKGHYVSAARLYAAALERAPHPATTHHYQGACAAVLAATGTSKDADKLDKDKPAKLRQQALGWLNGSLAMGKNNSAGNPTMEDWLRYHLQLWQCDPDLASVREEKELAKLPEAERKEWQALWAEAAAVVNAGKK